MKKGASFVLFNAVCVTKELYSTLMYNKQEQ